MTTFTHSMPGTYDAATDTFAPPETWTLTGSAMQVRGDPDVYKALSLIESEAPTLLWVPEIYGDAAPDLGWTCVWSNVTYTVRSVLPLAPDGVVITAKIVVAR